MCWTHTGGDEPRNLPVLVPKKDTRWTYWSCATSCAALNLFGTAGVENGTQCWCSPTGSVGPRGHDIPKDRCDVPCPGSKRMKCGGPCAQTQFAFACLFVCDAGSRTCQQRNNGTYESYDACMRSTLCGPIMAGQASNQEVGLTVMGSLLLTLMLYFGVGVCIRRRGQHARGWQQLPHAHFWLDLPGLIRDGALHMTSRCKKRTFSYEEL